MKKAGLLGVFLLPAFRPPVGDANSQNHEEEARTPSSNVPVTKPKAGGVWRSGSTDKMKLQVLCLCLCDLSFVELTLSGLSGGGKENGWMASE